MVKGPTFRSAMALAFGAFGAGLASAPSLPRRVSLLAGLAESRHEVTELQEAWHGMGRMG